MVQNSVPLAQGTAKDRVLHQEMWVLQESPAIYQVYQWIGCYNGAHIVPGS